MMIGYALIGALLAIATPAGADAADPLAVTADHLAIHVKDPEASAAFYQQVLGLARLPPRPRPDIVWLRANGLELHLIGGRSAAPNVPREVHLALRVPNLDAITKRLDAQSVTWGTFDGVARQKSLRPDGVRQIFFSDPDGYWVEVNQLP